MKNVSDNGDKTLTMLTGMIKMTTLTIIIKRTKATKMTFVTRIKGR